MDLTEEFARFADLMPEAMLLVNSTGRILAANHHAAHVLGGRRPAELVGLELGMLAEDPPEQLAVWLRSCARSRSLLPGALRLQAGDAQIQFRSAGGLYRPASAELPAAILVRLTPRKEVADPFVALNLRIEELTAQVRRRRQAEEALHAEREMLRVTLESIGDAVMATDERGRITFLNPVAEALTGWPVEEAQGHDLDEVFVIVNERTRQPVQSPVAQVLRKGVVVGLANHTILIRRDGAELPIDDSGAPIRDELGRLLGVVLVFHDVSDRRALERELEKRNRNLVEADKRKDEFLAMLAHELRNPLAPLRSAVHILDHAAADRPMLDELSAMMSRQVQHLTRLVDDLLDVSRITRGRIELHRRPVALEAIVRHALEMVEHQMVARGHQVSLSVPPGTMTVDADDTRLSQVFSNLLSNAAKFTDPGGHIEAVLEPEKHAFVVRIRDNGIGIEPQMLDEIFQLFAQADRSLDRSQGGLGLGLTVAKEVVEMHHGRLTAHSAGLGHGSEFTVILPAWRESAAAASATPAAEEEAAPRAGRSRVLVVDDNRDAAMALATLARLWGHDVRVAHDGREALDVAREFVPRVVLLDLGLPGLDGFEVARQLRQDPVTAAAQLVAVTGYGRDEDRRVSRDAGFDDHLTKPVDPEVVARLLADDVG